MCHSLCLEARGMQLQRWCACCVCVAAARWNRKRHSESVFCCMSTSLRLLDIFYNNYVRKHTTGWICRLPDWLCVVSWSDDIMCELLALSALITCCWSPSELIAMNDICCENMSVVVRLHVNTEFTRCGYDFQTVWQLALCLCLIIGHFMFFSKFKNW